MLIEKGDSPMDGLRLRRELGTDEREEETPEVVDEVGAERRASRSAVAF
jgi:hypothetical protein